MCASQLHAARMTVRRSVRKDSITTNSAISSERFARPPPVLESELHLDRVRAASRDCDRVRLDRLAAKAQVLLAANRAAVEVVNAELKATTASTARFWACQRWLRGWEVGCCPQPRRAISNPRQPLHHSVGQHRVGDLDEGRDVRALHVVDVAVAGRLAVLGAAVVNAGHDLA